MATPPTADTHGGRSVSPAIVLPADALVLLIGIAASGKTTFAARHFAPTEVLSSDAFRALIADNPSAQGATDDAFDLLHRLLEMRLRRGRLTVVDATNVEDWARAELIKVGEAASTPRRGRDRPRRADRGGGGAERQTRVSAPSAIGPPPSAAVARRLPAGARARGIRCGPCPRLGGRGRCGPRATGGARPLTVVRHNGSV